MSLWAFRFVLWYICILMVQPQNRFPFLYPLHIADLCVMGAVGFHIMSALSEGRALLRMGPATIMALVLIVASILSLWVGPFQTNSDWSPTIDIVVKNCVVLMLVEAMAFSIDRVYAVQATMLLASLWWIKGGLRLSAAGAIFAGDRLMGPSVGLVENPNGFAYMMCVLIPLYLYFYQQARVRYLRGFFLATALAGIFIVFQTGSRTGMLILIAMGLFLVPKYAAKYKTTFAVGGLAIFLLLGAVGKMNIDRFKSIPQSIAAFFGGKETVKADDEMTQDEQSAQERRLKNRDTWALIKDYPMFGVGISADESQYVRQYPMAAGQVHCEILMAGRWMGMVGMTLYVIPLIILLRSGMRVQREAKLLWPALADMGWTFKMQMLVFVIGGAFSPLPWNAPMMVLVGAASALWGNLRVANETGEALSSNLLPDPFVRYEEVFSA